MDLWIRSQDKKKLIKVNEIKIESVKDGNSFIYSDTTDLGTYISKERALEVLDEIQNIIMPKPVLQAKPMLRKETMDRIQEDYGMTVLPSCVDVIEPISLSVVYEMPKE